MDPAPILETEVEIKTRDYAKLKKVLPLKLNVLGTIGWPDRLFLYQGQVLFIEFKRQDEKVRKIQFYVHELIRRQGFHVVVVDTISQGRAAIDQLTQDLADI